MQVKRKRGVVFKEFKVEAKFVGLQDVAHLSLASTVSLALRSFHLSLFTVSPVYFKDLEFAPLRDECCIFQISRAT
jgi:hypothetical protein